MYKWARKQWKKWSCKDQSYTVLISMTSKMVTMVTWMLFCCLDTVMKRKRYDASDLPRLGPPTLKQYLWSELSHIIRKHSTVSLMDNPSLAAMLRFR